MSVDPKCLVSQYANSLQGVIENRVHGRIILKFTTRMEIIGCIKIDRKLQEQPLRNVDIFRTLTYIRDPTPEGRKVFLSFTYRHAEAARTGQADFVAKADLSKDDEDDDANAEADAQMEADAFRSQLDIETRSTTSPTVIWTPDRQIQNLVFEVIDHAGLDGISTIVSVLISSFFICVQLTVQ